MSPVMLPEDEVRIHLVRGGKTFCKIVTSEMKKKERWIEVGAWDEGNANCPGCLAEKKARKLRALGIDVNKLKMIG
jgi:hypothetical protein